VCLCAFWVATTGCTYPSARLVEVPVGTPVADVIREFGAPREDTRDAAGWMAHTCPSGTGRALAYDSWGGPLGSVMTRLTHYDITIVCVGAGDRVSRVIASQY